MPPPRPKGRTGRIVYWTLFGIFAAALIGLGTGVVVSMKSYIVRSATMEPTLQPGNQILVQRGSGDVRRGDVVVINLRDVPRVSPGLYNKRLIGLPGDRVSGSALPGSSSGEPGAAGSGGARPPSTG